MLSIVKKKRRSRVAQVQALLPLGLDSSASLGESEFQGLSMYLRG